MVNEIQTKYIDIIKSTSLPIIIFGASYIGKLSLAFCVENDILVRCFCDNNFLKTEKKFLDVEIISTDELLTNFSDAFFIIGVTDIQDVVKQLTHLGYANWCGAGDLLQHYTWNADLDAFNGIKVNNPVNYGRYILNTCINSHKAFLKDNFSYIRSIDLVITERCSLKCRDCSNLMQYYTNPKNCDTSKVIESSKFLSEICDEINEIRVIGGEPFMNKEWFTIIEELKNLSNINYIIIYTNGTIVPKSESLQCLKKDNIFVNVTDYGDISMNVHNLLGTFDKNGINYFYYTARGWTACGSIKKRNRTPKQEKEVFAKCCAKNLITFIEGKIYRCPFVANLGRLIEISDGKSDSVDVLEITDMASEKEILRKRIDHYLYKIETLQSCDYCAGRSLSDIEIEPGVQTPTPLEIQI
jgi:4Fe-4S single cluster protein